MSNPQWKTITDSLKKRIESGELAPGHRIPSEQDVAATWGVSRNTAHRAIRELQSIGLVVRQRRWGTVVNAQNPTKTGRVALIFDKSSQSYNFPSWQAISGIQDALGDSVHLVCRECKQDPEEERRLLLKLSEETDGIIIYPTAHPSNTPILQQISDTRHLVVLDRIPEGLEADSVASDNQESTFRAVKALADKGHKRIGFFSFKKPDFSTVGERYQAYENAMAEVNITDVSRYVRWFARDLDNSPEELVQSVHDSLFTLLHQPDPITSLFCVEDCFAASAMQACDQMHVRIFDDLELATFNDWPPMMLRRPWQAHRIVQNSYDIGFEAGSILLRRIAGNKEPRITRRVRAEFFVAGTGLQPDLTVGSQAGQPTTLATKEG